MKIPLIVAVPYTEGTPPGRTRGVVLTGCFDGAGGDAELPPRSPKASRAISATPATAPITEVASIGRISTFWFLASARAFKRADIIVGDEIVDRLHVALGYGIADHLCRHGFSFCRSLPRLGIAIGGFAAALGGEDLRLLGAFRRQDRRLPLALGHQDGGALVALGLHLPRHGVDQIARRLDVLDLDTRDLDAPIAGRVVDHLQQAMVDLVALRQKLVQIHGAHHRADVGHGEVEDRRFEVVDLIARLRRVHHLIEGNAVHLHHGVILGDHLLARHLHHLLHHVELAPDAVDEGDDQGKAGAQRTGVAAEALDRIVPALRHDFDARREHGDEQNEQDEDEDIEAEHGTLLEVSGERVEVSYSTRPSIGSRYMGARA